VTLTFEDGKSEE